MKKAVFATIVVIAVVAAIFSIRQHSGLSETQLDAMELQHEIEITNNEETMAETDAETVSKDQLRLSEKEAMAIVKERFGEWYGDRVDKAEVTSNGDTYVIVIPTKRPEVPKGKLWYGPSFSVRIVLDAQSGEIVEAVGGR